MGDEEGGGGGLPDGDEWRGTAVEMELDMAASMSLEDLWSSEFLPPPPRPTFLEDHVAPDGLTTCDICNWALHDLPGYNSSQGNERVSWALTLTIVSIVSAILGAFVMLILLHCRRNVPDENCDSTHNGAVLNLGRIGGGRKREMLSLAPRGSVREGHTVELDKEVSGVARRGPSSASSSSSAAAVSPRRSAPCKPKTKSAGKLLAWLTSGRRKEAPSQLGTPMCSIPAATNHYTCTNLDEPYSPVSEVSEAVYAELDRVPTPAYQNTSYLESSDAGLAMQTLSHNFYSDMTPVHYEQVNAYSSPGVGAGNVYNSSLSNAVPSDYI